jgi:hypothetical protein
LKLALAVLVALCSCASAALFATSALATALCKADTSSAGAGATRMGTSCGWLLSVLPLLLATPRPVVPSLPSLASDGAKAEPRRGGCAVGLGRDGPPVVRRLRSIQRLRRRHWPSGLATAALPVCRTRLVFEIVSIVYAGGAAGQQSVWGTVPSGRGVLWV